MNLGVNFNKKINLIKYISIILFSILLIYPILLLPDLTDTNLVVNPSFESGNTSPLNWTFVTHDANTPIWDNVNHSGTKSIKISSMVTKGMESGYAKSDLIRAEPGKYYTFTAWIKKGNDQHYRSAVRVVELDSNMNFLQQTNLVIDNDTNGWIQKGIDFQTNSNTMYFYIYANIWKGYGTFWVDDVSLSLKNPAPIPSPSQAAIPDPLSVSSGNIYYVAKNGYDNNPGTEVQPWLTITKAANTVVAGDSVYFKEGTYNEKIYINKSGSIGKNITFAAYPGETVTIDGNGIVIPDRDGLVRIYGSNYVNISGFRIINSRFVGVMITSDNDNNFPTNIIIEKNYIGNTASSAIFVKDGKDITIDGNEITKAQTREGVPQHLIGHETISLLNVDGFEIKNNKLYNNNFETIDAKEGSSNGKIHHNDIIPNESCGIYIDAWSGASHDIEIFNNRIHDGKAGSRGIALAVENKGSLKNVKVYNNLIYSNAATGVDISWYSNGPVDNILIISNTIYNNGLIDSWGGGISADYSSATNVTIENNIVSKNNQYSIQSKGATAVIDHNFIDGYIGGKNETKGSNYVEGDPQFVDPVNGDFHLKSTSPAIDTGSYASTQILDFEGKFRPIGFGYDIGAYEYSP